MCSDMRFDNSYMNEEMSNRQLLQAHMTEEPENKMNESEAKKTFSRSDMVSITDPCFLFV